MNKPLISIDDAWKIICDIKITRETIQLPIQDSLGHVLAEPMRAKRSHPWTDISALDGYAYSHDNTKEILRSVGVSEAGKPYQGKPIAAGECVRIMTGAFIPEGCDCVAGIEVCQAREKLITVPTLKKGSNVRTKGSDVYADTLLKKPGSKMTAKNIAAGLAADVDTVMVHPKISVRLIATGTELRSVDNRVQGATVNSNVPALTASLNDDHINAIDDGICIDSTKAIIPKIVQLQSQADVLIFSGGISVGDKDLVRECLLSLGAKILFHGINVKPGKPALLAKLGDCYVLGLPGNPVSNFVCGHLLAKTLCRHLAGEEKPLPEHHIALTRKEMSADLTRTEFIRARYKMDSKGRAIVESYINQDSVALHTLSLANCLIRLEPDKLDKIVGDPVSIFPI